MPPRVEVEVIHEDALLLHVDVLALKFAQGHYGLDAIVAKKLSKIGRHPASPGPWQFSLDQGASVCAALKILVVGVPSLNNFGYQEIRRFARTVLSCLAQLAPDTRQIGLTVHGVEYGLDEVEAFEAEVAGLLDGVRGGDAPPALRRIVIVEIDPRRAERLRRLLADLLPTGAIEPEHGVSRSDAQTERLRAAGYASAAKPHVFVAMPFKQDMEDVYHYGIQGAVRSAGFLCERADLSAFAGDVLEWVRTRIKKATLVIADLTDANPNVYLEVGYAWGCGIPTVLLSRDVQHLTFDTRGQRCLIYNTIKDLEEILAQELRGLSDAGVS